MRTSDMSLMKMMMRTTWTMMTRDASSQVCNVWSVQRIMCQE